MPFYWVNSVFMIFYIVMTLVFFYFYKNLESVGGVYYIKDGVTFFNLKW